MNRNFWDGVAARLRPIGVFATVENPRVVVRIFVAVLAFSVTSALVHCALYLWFDETAPAISSLLLAVAFVAALFWLLAIGGLRGVMVIALIASAADVVFLQFAMGGYAYSGDTMAWSIAIVMTAALVFRSTTTAALGAGFATLAIAFGFMEESLQASREPPDPSLTSVLFATVLVGVLGLLLLMFMTMLGRLMHERRRAEELLLNVLPPDIAAELKRRGRTTARRYDGISVLFADIVGFTPLSATREPEEMVAQLNEVFSHFDTLVERYDVEKIRTIGDAYMVAAGVPVPRDDHASVLCALALDMLSYAAAGPLSFRIGINSGPAVAGVIGARKFQYDIWGDTVNTASRMESHGEPGRIQITDATYQLIKDGFATTPRGPVEVKGKGTLDTWWLDGAAVATV